MSQPYSLKIATQCDRKSSGRRWHLSRSHLTCWGFSVVVALVGYVRRSGFRLIWLRRIRSKTQSTGGLGCQVDFQRFRIAMSSGFMGLEIPAAGSYPKALRTNAGPRAMG